MIQARFTLTYPGFTLDVALELPALGVTAIYGHSGSGKTTLLRCIAGLEPAARGHLQINDEIWQERATVKPTYQRSLGYVFQEARLFPHLSIRQNLEYGFKRVPVSERKIQLEQVVALLGLNPLVNRKDSTRLSGGERQRVAIGRALLTSPRLLLMDEPLSALDSQSKQEILPYLERLHSELQIPVLYVSHVLDEVARLADHLVILKKGQVIACGPIHQILARLDLPTAHLEEASTVIEATVSHHDNDYHLTRLDFKGGQLWVNQVERAMGSVIRIRIRAADVSIATVTPQGSSINNILVAQIAEMQEEDAYRVNVRLKVGDGHVLLSRITRRSRDQLGLVVGMQVFAQVKSVALMA